MPERCVHCLAIVDEITADHWLPKSWYPSSTAPELAKWSFPCCQRCNSRLSQVEDRLRHRLALALDPASAAAEGILESAHRSFDPAVAKNERDARTRTSRRAALMRDIVRGDKLPAHSILPGLGPAADVPLDQQVVTLIDPADLEQFVEKLVRGLTYLQLRAYIEPDHFISMQLLSDADAHIYTDSLDKSGQVVDRSPGIVARVERAFSDPLSALFEFVVWNRLRVFASVRPRT